MYKTESSSSHNITRRDFLCGSAALLAGVSELKYSTAFIQQKVSPNTDYSSVIEKIKQSLPVTMKLKDISGASIALVIGVVLLTNQSAAHNAPYLASGVIESMLVAKLGVLPKNKTISPTDKPVISLDESALKRLEGTYLLYEGILLRFKYDKGNLFHIVGNEKLKLEAHSPNDFTSGSRRYKFLLDENGKPKGVQIFDSYYDVQTAENSVIYLPINETPSDPRGLNKPEWSRRVGKYAGTFIGGGIEVKVSLKNGYLYLNGELKLTEIKPDFLVTADGEAVIFKGEQLSVGNLLYSNRK